ncbi:response regulator [Marinobacter sp. G11]|uniref:response regulator n=1 Tax=Marinobacter sp. G11 TaxID=2903522 RepID=UPI001E4B7F29|nr:response regulator [Marinobacter sp. G11]MCE0759798.1 response regulator [Marinobacter sp. G11]
MPRGHALIIEDSSTARIILARLLERADISSKAVATAEEAFPVLQSDHFDVIFLDHMLPGMNGFQALEKLKSLPDTRDIPVFMYTSQNAGKYIEEARALGAAGVIRKQVDREQLMRTLDLILSDIPEPEHSEALRLAVENVGQPVTEAPEQAQRKISGRMSTLEVAYEELEEQLRELKQQQEEKYIHQAEQSRRLRKNTRWLSAAVVTLVIALAWITSRQAGQLQAHAERTSDRFALMQSIMGGLIELISK